MERGVGRQKSAVFAKMLRLMWRWPEWNFRGRRPRLQRAIGVNRPYLRSRCKLGTRQFVVDEANDLQEYW